MVTNAQGAYLINVKPEQKTAWRRTRMQERKPKGSGRWKKTNTDKHQTRVALWVRGRKSQGRRWTPARAPVTEPDHRPRAWAECERWALGCARVAAEHWTGILSEAWKLSERKKLKSAAQWRREAKPRSWELERKKNKIEVQWLEIGNWENKAWGEKNSDRLKRKVKTSNDELREKCLDLWNEIKTRKWQSHTDEEE
jgi:hypothetical protein